MLFTFPSRYSFPIGGLEYVALEGGPPCFPQDFACPVVLRVHGVPSFGARRGLPDSHRLWSAFPGRSADAAYSLRGAAPQRKPRATTPLQPRGATPPRPRTARCRAAHRRGEPLPCVAARAAVWAQAASLATTTALSYLISVPRGTLDVSVPAVPLGLRLSVFSARYGGSHRRGLPHSESAGSSLACSSPATFRRSPRPSSAPGP